MTKPRDPGREGGEASFAKMGDSGCQPFIVASQTWPWRRSNRRLTCQLPVVTHPRSASNSCEYGHSISVFPYNGDLKQLIQHCAVSERQASTTAKLNVDLDRSHDT